MGDRLRVILMVGIGCAAGVSCAAQDASARPDAAPAKASKYPLRLHVLSIEDTHRTVRLQPNWCSGSMPDPSAGETPGCSNDGASGLGGGDDDFSGAGRGDLVTPPDGTAGLNFTYEGCSRVRVQPGFAGLEARWTKPGAKLEVLIPTDAISDHGDRKDRTQRCTLKVKTQEFVYLRLRNGSIVRVSQQAYWKKPALRMFLSGGTETLERRTSVVSVKDLERQQKP